MSRLIDTFISLVKVDSITGQEEHFANSLVKLLTPLVDMVKKDKFGNVYARLNGRSNSVFFSCHMDTVEPGRSINPQVKNGYMTSDGTTILGADDKVGIAAILESLQQIKELKINTKTLEFIFTRSEESGGYGAINFDYKLLSSKEGYCFDFSAPIGTVVIASPFYERFDIEIIGKSAHASRVNEGINALQLLGDVLSQIRLGEVDSDTLLNIGVIEGGSVRNAIPGDILLKGEVRSFSEEKLTNCRNNFLKVLKEVAKKNQAKLKIDVVRENSGYKLDHDNIFLVKTGQLISNIGIKPKFQPAWGVSDVNIFRDHNLDCLNLSDGGEFAHTTRERVKISEMEKLVKLMFGLCRIEN